MASSEADQGWPNVPVLGTPDDLPLRPDRPYRASGSQKRGRLAVHIVIAVLAAVAAGGWGYVMWAAKGETEVIREVVSFDVARPDSVRITYEIHKPDDQAALCRLRATDTDHVEVGTKEVTIPAGEANVRRTDWLDTSAQATSVHVQYCYLV